MPRIVYDLLLNLLIYEPVYDRKKGWYDEIIWIID